MPWLTVPRYYMPMVPISGGNTTNVGHIQSALEELYGQRGGQGVALRAGRSGFNHLLRAEGKEMGLTETNYRMLPYQTRIYMGLQLLAQKLSAMIARPVQVEEHEAHWLWRMEKRYAARQRRRSAEPVFFHYWFFAGISDVGQRGKIPQCAGSDPRERTWQNVCSPTREEQFVGGQAC